MRIQLGKKTVEISAEELYARIVNYKQVLVDIGTGDGQFVYRWAVSHPETFCIGLDAVAENMREVSARTLKKPARGGLSNALFVVASVELLPAELSDIADVVTINFPWGSLLRALVTPEPEILRAIAGMAKRGTKLKVLLNYSVFKDQDYIKRMGLSTYKFLVHLVGLSGMR
jgi:16S rRNA (adenine(1408)-N(1))-methyltransferase